MAFRACQVRRGKDRKRGQNRSGRGLPAGNRDSLPLASSTGIEQDQQERGQRQGCSGIGRTAEAEGEPTERDHGEAHRQGHGMTERVHPRTRTRQHATQGRNEADQQERQGKAQSERAEDGERRRRRQQQGSPIAAAMNGPVQGVATNAAKPGAERAPETNCRALRFRAKAPAIRKDRRNWP
jgi:hypothetical protein